MVSKSIFYTGGMFCVAVNNGRMFDGFLTARTIEGIKEKVKGLVGTPYSVYLPQWY